MAKITDNLASFIPKVIHQVWIGPDKPKRLEVLTRTWKKHHPNWKYLFWNESKCRKFIIANFPSFLTFWNCFESDIQKADVIRYLILYNMGGVYVDMDFECYTNIESLLNGKLCVLSKEPVAHCNDNNQDLLICNAFMATVAGHDFFRLLIQEIKKPVKNYNDKNKIIMESTGPYMVTRVFEVYKNENITILEPELLYPLTRDEIILMMNPNTFDPLLQSKLDNSLAVHYWLNSWTV